MKNSLLIAVAFATLMLTSCEEQNHKYKYVVSISHTEHTYQVTVINNSGGNVVERGAGGAIIGGSISLLLGSSAKSGAIIGGLLGASTTDNPKTESYIKTRTDINYKITYSDSTIDLRTNYCPYTIGDSVIIF